MNDDQRAEAVEVMAQARHDRDGGVLAWKDCHDVYRDQLRKDARLDLDALTKPRTGPCEVCGGTGDKILYDQSGYGNPPDRESCDACGGSGTVTRGPIAVLVPPDAVEIMARVVALRARGGGNPWSRDRVLAEAILDALCRRTGAG